MGDPMEERWAEFDAALREMELPAPAPGLRERCFPGSRRSPHERRLRRVLVVDDEPNIRRLVQVHLTRGGYEVELAANGAEALERVRERRPDLVVLDVLMPGVDGRQVLRALKEDPRTADIPVLLLTARSADDQVRDGWREGTDFYMTKPFNPEELRAVVDRFAEVIGTPDNPPPLRRWLK